MRGKGNKAVSPVLATLLMIAVAVSMSVILFMWSQNFLASTSQAASSQQQSQNVAAQSSIAIESVQFTDAKALKWDGTETSISGGSNKVIKIVVRNVGSSKVTLGQVYVGTSAYQMTPYNIYKALRSDTNPGVALTLGVISGPKYWYTADAAVDKSTNDPDWNPGEGYQGTITTIYTRYLTDDQGGSTTDLYTEQVADTAIAYVFGSDGSADTDGELDPQGFAVVHLYLSSAWTTGETYYIRVTTTVGTFADVTVTAPTS